MTNDPLEMSFLDHLAHLRTCLLRSLAFVSLVFILCFYYSVEIIGIFNQLFESYFKDGYLIGTKPGDAFFLRLKVAIFSAFFASSPYLFFEVWRFVSPGLKASEKKLMIPFVLSASSLFLLGSIFCYYLVLPIIFNFFADQYSLVGIAPAIQVSEHLAFSIQMILCFAVTFELPIISWILARAGILTYAFMKNNLNYAIVIIFVFAAIITPPDVVSQILMAIPLVILYFISMLIVKNVEPTNT